MQFPGEATVDIPNDASYSDSKIATEGIYIDDSLKDMLYLGDPIYFPQPCTDDRKDFELNVSGDDLIIFKSLTLNFVGVAKEEFRFTIVKNVNKRFSSMKKADIDQQLQSHKRLNQLIEDQIKLNKTNYQNFGDEYKGNKLKNKFRNVTARKKKRKVVFCS